MKLKRNLTREKLSEGRNKGLSFAFCRRISNIFKEVMPLSACKDYMSDVIWAETEKKQSPKFYGFSHTPSGFYNKAKYAYLSVAKVTSNKSDEPTKVDLNLYLPFIHAIEESLKLPKTKVHETDQYPVLQISKYWVKYPYLISMYTLFFRVGNQYKGDLEAFFTKHTTYAKTEIITKRGIA